MGRGSTFLPEAANLVDDHGEVGLIDEDDASSSRSIQPIETDIQDVKFGRKGVKQCNG